jgi:hypothetical protein
LIRRFENIEGSLHELDELAGRLAIETGQFWAQVPAIDRKTSVDQKLLSDLDVSNAIWSQAISRAMRRRP